MKKIVRWTYIFEGQTLQDAVDTTWCSKNEAVKAYKQDKADGYKVGELIKIEMFPRKI